MLHRTDGQVDAGHAAELLGPQTARIDDVIGRNGSLLGYNRPMAIRAMLKLQKRDCAR